MQRSGYRVRGPRSPGPPVRPAPLVRSTTGPPDGAANGRASPRFAGRRRRESGSTAPDPNRRPGGRVHAAGPHSPAPRPAHLPAPCPAPGPPCRRRPAGTSRIGRRVRSREEGTRAKRSGPGTEAVRDERFRRNTRTRSGAGQPDGSGCRARGGTRRVTPRIRGTGRGGATASARPKTAPDRRTVPGVRARRTRRADRPEASPEPRTHDTVVPVPGARAAPRTAGEAGGPVRDRRRERARPLSEADRVLERALAERDRRALFALSLRRDRLAGDDAARREPRTGTPARGGAHAA